jgi:epoxyqueuosine reductase QueG
MICIEHCPSKAITGSEWSRSSPFVELVKLNACRSHKAAKRAIDNKPNCGLCINICPYGRKNQAPSIKHNISNKIKTSMTDSLELGVLSLDTV